MAWLTFITKLVDALAWPIAVIVSVFLFRERLRALLPLLRVKHRDWEASFRLDQAEAAASALPAVEGEMQLGEPTPEEKSTFEKVAEVSPRAAMLEVRTDIEQAVRSLAKRFELLSPKVQSTLGLIRLLRNRNVIDSQTYALLEDLRVVGNQAAHEENVTFTKNDAVRFRALADEVVLRLLSLESLR